MAEPRPTEEATPHHTKKEFENYELTTESIRSWVADKDWPPSHVIQQLHACLLSGIQSYETKGTLPTIPGQYRREDLEDHYGVNNFFARGTDVAPLMKEYSEDLAEVIGNLPQNPKGNIEKIAHAAAWSYYTYIRIHPFLDGNGRVGRCIINRIIMGAGMQPLIFGEDWYGQSQQEHQDTMDAVHKTNNLTHLELYILKKLKATAPELVQPEIDQAIENKSVKLRENVQNSSLEKIWPPFGNIDIHGGIGSNVQKAALAI